MKSEFNDLIKINYKIVVYDYTKDEFKKNEQSDMLFQINTLFVDSIKEIAIKHHIDNEILYVKDLKTKTWGKILDENCINLIIGDDYHYGWLNYKLIDIQTAFSLFDEELEIVVNGPGIGESAGIFQGITFCINNNEKDRHQFQPHVHCKYSGEEMRIRIDTLKIMKNDKPFKNKRKVRIAIAWVEQNQKYLLDYYNRFILNKDNEIKFIAEI